MSEHIVSKATYYRTFGALLLLTALTTGVAFINLHSLNIVVALLIAGLKAGLVITFFMHIKYSTKLTKMWVAVGFIWFIILIGITMTDYLSRGWLVYKP